MNLRRGFKAEGERIAAEVREELKLCSTDPLDVFELARQLEIPVYTLRELRAFSDNPIFVEVFCGVEQDAFSAMTVFIGTRRLIVHNESHFATRQASNISHEISHCLLEHSPTPVSSSGCRCWDNTVEDEATWLGAALLVPREGALRLARNGMDIQGIADRFGVSEPLCRWRIAQTGIAYQLLHSQKYR